MAERQHRHTYWRYIGALFFILMGLALVGSTASASQGRHYGARAIMATRAEAPQTCPGAYHYFLPQPGSPPSGGTVSVGDRFTLDLMIHSDPYTIRAQDAYFTFTNALLQNVRATSAGCVVTSTVTGDYSAFDTPLQDEVCNGPSPCTFRGILRQPGQVAYSSGSIFAYNGPDFRIAQVAFCAVAPGQAIIHWQFSPPNPPNLDTEIVDNTSPNPNIVNVPSCYEDYVVNIVPPVYTPTQTPLPTDTPTATDTPTSIPTITPGGPTLTPTPTTCPGAYHYFLPQPGSPPNGGTANVGDRITLDMMVHSNPYTVNAQQAYLIFSSSLLQNVRADQPGCVLTSTVTKDQTIFDAQLQNETCNGPNLCNFRGNFVNPGSMAYVSAIGINPSYNGPDFRVAQVAFCVIAPGVATLHWQFAPPDPRYRDTEILNSDGILVHAQACYVDYTINIPGATSTPTSTPGARLVGHVTWQLIPQGNVRSILPITLTLKMGNLEVNYPVQNTDAMGFFTNSVAGLPSGTYTWRVQGPVAAPDQGRGFLANSGAVTLTGVSQTNMENGLMKGGDGNNNNLINIFDFNMVKNSFGQSGWLACDFNNDQVANATDFNILKGNFGMAGAPPAGP